MTLVVVPSMMVPGVAPVPLAATLSWHPRWQLLAIDGQLLVFQRLRDPMAQVERLRVALREWFDKSEWVREAYGIITENKFLIEQLQQIGRVARSEMSVLILGESGTGKELVVAAIHDASPRKNAPLVEFIDILHRQSQRYFGEGGCGFELLKCFENGRMFFEVFIARGNAFTLACGDGNKDGRRDTNAV